MPPHRAELHDYEIVHTFSILHAGWEMDNEAWIGRDKSGRLVLLMTNHGGLWDYGRDVSELHNRIKETRESLAGIKKAIALINQETPTKDYG